MKTPGQIIAAIRFNPHSFMTPAFSRRLAATLAFALGLVSSVLAASRWGTVTPEDFKNKVPLIDPEAGAEVMLAETIMDEERPDDIQWTHFIRVRIVDDRGVGLFRKIEIPFDDSTSISSIEARTYKPDGTVLSLDKKEIFARDVVKTRSVRHSVKSFAPAGLESGVIFEYSYVEHRDHITPLWALHFPRDIPVRLARYRIRPYPAAGFDLRSISFNLPPFSLKPDSQGFFTFEATNLKGWKNEPFQIPPIQLQASAIIYYSPQEGNMTAQAYWGKIGAGLYKRTESAAKASKAVRAALEGLFTPSDSADVKLRKIHDFVRTKLKNRDLDAAGYTREQRQKLPKNENAEDTLNHGQGNGDDLVIVFTALARAAGFDARLAMASDRTFIIFEDTMREPFIFRKLVAAVRTGDTWTYSDPGAVYLPYGMVDWKYTGTNALVADRDHALLPRIPIPAPTVSGRTRKATLTLDDQGTLEGRVTVAVSGYLDAAAKNRYDALSPEEREKSLKDEVQKQFPLAELSEIVIEHAEDPLLPMTLSYKLRLPEFAERTGSRLFFQPAVLHKGVPPMFEAPDRRSAILFNYLYEETDAIEIVVPPGFQLEAGNAPAGLNLGKLGRYEVSIGYSAKSGKITYDRVFELSAPGVAAKFYPAVRRLFEEINSQDNHTLTFHTAAETASTVGQAPAPEEKKG